MYFVIKDNDNCRWAYGETEATNKTINFKSICDYLMSSLHPEIFTIVFFEMVGTAEGIKPEIREEVKLVDYMNRKREEVRA